MGTEPGTLVNWDVYRNHLPFTFGLAWPKLDKQNLIMNKQALFITSIEVLCPFEVLNIMTIWVSDVKSYISGLDYIYVNSKLNNLLWALIIITYSWQSHANKIVGYNNQS